MAKTVRMEKITEKTNTQKAVIKSNPNQAKFSSNEGAKETPITPRLRLKKTENTNTIMEQKNYNNENWGTLDEAVQRAIDKKDQTVFVGKPGQNIPPEDALIWIDPEGGSGNAGSFISVGENEPTDPNVVLWLDTKN